MVESDRSESVLNFCRSGSNMSDRLVEMHSFKCLIVSIVTAQTKGRVWWTFHII